MKTMKKYANRKRTVAAKGIEEKKVQIPSAFSMFVKRSKQDNEIL
jgi:hypothetical protein